MPLASLDLSALCAHAATAMRDHEADLNAADRQLGDGDTGQTMRRLFEKIAEAAGDPPDDLGEFFKAIGRAGASATGSSLGTLLSVSLLAVGKSLAGRTEIETGELGGLIRIAEETVLARGGASLGDKTVADMLHALGEANSPEEAVAAASRTLDEFRPKPCRMGRARMFSERSAGLDDPGMLAFFYLVKAAASFPNAK